MKLNLGCGADIKEGYVNLDSIKAPGVDVAHNLMKVPYPFKEGQFDEIYASHVLEHLDGDWFAIMKELYRILKKGGVLIVKVPHFTSAIAYIENHRRFFRFRSFESFEEQSTMTGLDQKEGYRFKVAYRKIKFLNFPTLYNVPVSWFVNSSTSAALLYENTVLRALFPAHELVFHLKKV